MKKKLLFISYIDPEGCCNYGGGRVCYRNYIYLKGKFNVTKFILKRRSGIKSFFSIIEGYMPPALKEDRDEVLRIVRDSDIDAIWIDNSMCGSILADIRKIKPNIKIYSYFHNVEADYVYVRIGSKIKQALYAPIAKKQEMNTVKYSDVCFSISDRDVIRLTELYGYGNYVLAPVSFDDIYESKETTSSLRFVGLFVGAYGRANYESIKWFLENTSLNDEVTIQIVGKDFEYHEQELKQLNFNVNLDVVGSVNNLEEYYYQSDFVLAPIVIGSGMKVKIAEALMYGKTIIGTEEAFAGYNLDFEKIGCKSDNIAELDAAILSVKKGQFGNKFNEFSRYHFIENYSTKAIYGIFDSHL